MLMYIIALVNVCLNISFEIVLEKSTSYLTFEESCVSYQFVPDIGPAK